MIMGIKKSYDKLVKIPEDLSKNPILEKTLIALMAVYEIIESLMVTINSSYSMGRRGMAFGKAGVLISAYGTNIANKIHNPRIAGAFKLSCYTLNDVFDGDIKTILAIN